MHVGLVAEILFQHLLVITVVKCERCCELQETFAKHASSAAKDPQLEDLQSQRRHLQSELTEQRHMVDILKKERLDLESEVRKLRLTKEQTERRIRYPRLSGVM